jgi:hypothetical protein
MIADLILAKSRPIFVGKRRGIHRNARGMARGGLVMGDLGRELRLLCRGRGILAPNLPQVVGPLLRAQAGIDPAGNPAELRRELAAFLDTASADLPEDLRLAFRAGLALHESRPSRFLTERMKRLAARLDRLSEDTARAYLADAIAAVEATLNAPGRVLGTPPVTGSGAEPPQAGPDAEGHELRGWHLAALRVVLDLTGPQPIALEERTIVADSGLLAEIAVSTAIPRRQGGPAGPAAGHLDLAVLHGGTLARSQWLSATYLRYFVRLPHPLRRGAAHDIGVRLAIPPGQPLHPKYMLTPLLRCDELDLRVRFGPGAAGRSIWRIAGLPPGMADDFADPAELLHPDADGDVRLRFSRLRLGLSYGARWTD